MKKYFLLILIVYCSACQNQVSETVEQKEPEGQTGEISSEKQDSNVTILEEGFYGEPDADDSLSDAEGSLSVPEESESSRSGMVETTQEQDSIVEDFEFSTAHDVTEESEELRAEQLYCLGNHEPEGQDSAANQGKFCDQISGRLASISNDGCTAAKLVPSQCKSVQGFPILYREFAPLPGKTPLGRILVIGGTHGDELTSVSITFKWIEKLNKYHSGLFHWHIAPMINPDGVLKRGATRTNQNGVDLNRNMPSDDWEENAHQYWENKQGKNARRYPGEQAASEPETQWLIDEINSFKPDAIISVHAPYGVVDFDSLILHTAPKNLGTLHLNLLGTYPGSLGNYAGINRNIPVITLELPHAWVMPSDSETTKIWEDIVSWLRKNVGSDDLVQK